MTGTLLILIGFLIPVVATAEPAQEPVPLFSPEKLVRLVQAGEVTFIDVREPEEFAENHIPGAINIPQRDFDARKSEIPKDGWVIPYCNMDFRGFVAARELEAFGARVALMQERGITGWEAQDLPVVRPGGISDAEGVKTLRETPPETLLGERYNPKHAPTGEVHEIEMEAGEWYFEPNDLEIAPGDALKIRLTSVKGEHFFILPDYEIYAKLEEGKTEEVSFVADRAGDFRFGSCEWDGSSLQVMKGRLRVRNAENQ